MTENRFVYRIQSYHISYIQYLGVDLTFIRFFLTILTRELLRLKKTLFS